jgi:uncharacterized membrane protein
MMSTFRRAFLTGLLVLAPLGVTLWVFVLLFRTIDNWMRPLLLGVPYLRASLPEEGFTGIGVLTAILLVVLVGIFANNLLGKALFGSLDRILNRIPWIKGVYGAAKEISSVVFVEEGSAFRSVILFEYPRRGLYSIGFVTHEAEDGEPGFYHVFLPTTPNPTSGYFLMVPREDAKVLAMTVEHGLKLIVSAGAVVGIEDLAALHRTAGELARGECEN